MEGTLWFDSWSDLGRVALVGTAGYMFLVLVLRVSEKRTLSKLNSFDFVVTVALGSALATILLSSETSWAEGAVALALLAFLQFAAAWLTARNPRARGALTARPTLLLTKGMPVSATMKTQRVSMGEIRQAVRASGSGDLSQVAAVVLETDGSLSVISTDTTGNESALDDVAKPRPSEFFGDS